MASTDFGVCHRCKSLNLSEVKRFSGHTSRIAGLVIRVWPTTRISCLLYLYSVKKAHWRDFSIAKRANSCSETQQTMSGSDLKKKKCISESPP